MSDEFIISSGLKKITIKDESGEVRGMISFNPTDTEFAERFYKLTGEFKAKIDELQNRSKELEKDSRVDEAGLFLNTGERLAFVRETCIYIREKIDHLFGAGTSQIAFGDTLSLEIFSEFFEGILPFVQNARKKVLSKYTDNLSTKVMK